MFVFPKKPVELVTIANDNCLLPRPSLQPALDLIFSIAGENVKTTVDKHDPFDRPRTRQTYIDKNCKTTRPGYSYIQKVRLAFIDADGNSHRWKSDFPEKMYLRFINTKSEEALDQFIIQTGFCIFPGIRETELLFKEYAEKNINAPHIFHPGKEAINDLMEILLINKNFIARKRDELRDMVDQYRKGTLRYDQLLWVNQQMENISNIFIDGEHFIWKEIKKGVKSKVEKDARTIEELIGFREIQKMKIIPIIRAYGHYAYCCYEFFLDILGKNRVLACEDCERYFHPNRDGQFLCKYPDCIDERNRVKSRKSYHKLM